MAVVRGPGGVGNTGGSVSGVSTTAGNGSVSGVSNAGAPTRFGPFRLIQRVPATDSVEQYHALWSDARTSGERLCLLRLLPRELTGSPAFARMFASEVRTMGLLRHPNVVRAHAAGAIEGVPYLALEYLDGLTLAHVASARRAQRQRLPLEVAVYVGREVAAGLAYGHGVDDGNGRPLLLSHGDLRPSNVAVLRTGEIKLVGFGAARIVSFVTRGSAGSNSLTRARPVYHAPEQLAGVPGDARSDLYALGVMLWELVCSQPLFPTVASTANTVARPSQIRADVPPALDGLIMQLLERAPSRRRKSAEDVQRMLSTLLPAPDDSMRALAAMARGGMNARDSLPRPASTSRTVLPTHLPAKRPITRVVPALTALLRQRGNKPGQAQPAALASAMARAIAEAPARAGGRPPEVAIAVADEPADQTAIDQPIPGVFPGALPGAPARPQPRPLARPMSPAAPARPGRVASPRTAAASLLALLRGRSVRVVAQGAVIGMMAFVAGAVWQQLQVSPALPPSLGGSASGRTSGVTIETLAVADPSAPLPPRALAPGPEMAEADEAPRVRTRELRRVPARKPKVVNRPRVTRAGRAMAH